MQRRTLLVAAGSGMATITAGCLGDGDDEAFDPENVPDPEIDLEPGQYEQCDREVVLYSWLPDPVQGEVDAGRAGGYEAEHIFLEETIDPEQSHLRIDDDIYSPRVESGDGETRILTVERVRPETLPRSRTVAVETNTSGSIRVEIQAGGEVVLDETQELATGERSVFGSLSRIGPHTYRVFGDETQLTTDSINVDESTREVTILVDPEDTRHEIAETELQDCQFD